MAERKLNFNAPLLSVRRIGSRPMSPNARRTMQSDPPPPRPSEADLSLEQVTEAVSVPFHWEHIPGRVKDGNGAEPRPKKKQTALMKSKDQGEDVFSDALDTLSSNESVSLNCSASGLSGSDGSASLVQPSGSFSTDPQTRDYMINRFLPAAKAMALDPPRNYPSKKPREPNRMVSHQKRLFNDSKGPHLLVPRPGETEEEEETEDEDEEEQVEVYSQPKIISTSGCGLFPKLCFRNSLSLLGPIPGVKVTSPKPSKSAQNQSLTKSIRKAWDSYKKNSNSGTLSTELKLAENKRVDESRRFKFSGELKGMLSPFRSRATDTNSRPRKERADMRSRSGELGVVENKAWASESRRLAYSGELYRGRTSPFRNTRPVDVDQKRSAELKAIKDRRAGDSPRFTHSGDLQRATSSPFRASSISPYRNQSNQSPFRRAAFIGVPKVVKVDITRPKVEEQGSFSLSPAVEKTLYVDTVNNAKTSHHLGSKVQINSGVEHLLKPTGLQQLSVEKINKALERDAPVYVDDKRPPNSLEQKLEPFNCSERLTAKANINEDMDQNEDLLDLNSTSAQSPVPPPLPRSPSESWLWRTIPSISLRNSFGSKQAKNLDSKSSTKWETIVKTSKLHHDHARYSEELVAHIYTQSKT